MTDTFLTVEQAARRLAVTPYTMREWLKAGKVRGVQVSRRWRVPERALFELATATTAATPTKAPDDASTPEARAVNILAAFRSGDLARRNAAIVELARSDAATSAIVDAEVSREVEAYDGDDDDFAEWHALDGVPFHDDDADEQAAGNSEATQ